ncbi:MAG: 50S ribosomal protein L24 [Oligoflexia bacterium]|nr:50S ribosomal protein L24 [Oligoflexia bacterium]
MKLKIKKGDLVEVIAGKDKGKQGKVVGVTGKDNPNKTRVFVEGVNRVKRHTKPSQTNQQGGIIEKEAAIHLSNISLVDPKTNKGGRIKIVQGKKGERIRTFKKTGTELKA